MNNAFFINSSHELAITYNDIAVLENMHISKLFTIFLDSKNYFFSNNLSKDDYNRFRKLIISAILATDNARHF